MFPAYGLDDHARDRPWVTLEFAARTAASLQGTTIVSRAVPAVTPFESGRPIVSALDPALIKNASAEPIAAPRILDDRVSAR